MKEIELKFQVPQAHRGAVSAAVAGREAPRPMRLQAVYFETGDRRLATAQIALRLRREGRQWVQTLKGAGDDGMTRFEHNVARGAAAALPAVEPALHAGTPVGDRLLALLGGAAPASDEGSDEPPTVALHSLYRTDIRRRTRALVVRSPGRPQSRVELAFDSGRIESGNAGLDVCELEIELLAGTAQAVIDTARRWLPRHALWLDLRSKAERGDLLSRGEVMAEARTAVEVQLTRTMSATQAWRAVLRGCADQVLRNASQIASGEHAPEHVHQLRVGLRRLRSALKLFEADRTDLRAPSGDTAALGEAAATLFRQLGAARDAVVVEGEFAAGLQRAMAAAGVAAAAGPSALNDGAPSPVQAVRGTPSQFLLLDLLAAAQPVEGDALVDMATPLHAMLAKRLNRWHRQVLAGIARFDELDDESRHRLRKRAKRLRYAAEFSASLFRKRGVRRYLKSLRVLQERLGAISDVLMAMEAFARRGEADPQAMFARGWLAGRRVELIATAGPALKAFTKAERFWKGA